jgi:hypothetical protein
MPQGDAARTAPDLDGIDIVTGDAEGRACAEELRTVVRA